MITFSYPSAPGRKPSDMIWMSDLLKVIAWKTRNVIYQKDDVLLSPERHFCIIIIKLLCPIRLADSY